MIKWFISKVGTYLVRYRESKTAAMSDPEPTVSNNNGRGTCTSVSTVQPPTMVFKHKSHPCLPASTSSRGCEALGAVTVKTLERDGG